MRRTSGEGAFAALLVPLLVLCLVVGLVAVGLARGVWADNLHNGLLAFGFGFVGVAVLFQRPAQREGLLFLLVGVLEALLFFGRQVGHVPSGPADRWWAWLGVWPVAITICAVTWCVLCFPEGRFLTGTWRWIGVGAAALAGICSLLSALYPVEYDETGTTLAHPFDLPGRGAADAVWGVVAHPLYVALQLLWVVAVVARWRQSDGVVRRQLTVLLVAVGISCAGLVVGLAAADTSRPGIMLAALVPVAAGWAMERMSLAKVIEQEADAGHLDGLTPRENDVLDLMAQGLSNAAIASRLHLSVKTVEPVVSSVFLKLGLPSDADSNRRVLAVLEYLSRSAGRSAQRAPR
jgi:DNA-binding CsgD family transcriptional regulator